MKNLVRRGTMLRKFTKSNFVRAENVISGFFLNTQQVWVPQRNYRVVVAGAAGGIGQPLSMLLKMNPLVSELHMYDVAKIVPGVTIDVSHINTFTITRSYEGEACLPCAVKGADLIIIPAGVPRKPGMTRDDLFNVNAQIVYNICQVIAQEAPCAIIAVITNPINSVVPIAAEVMKMNGKFDARKVFGITTLDVIRACVFIGQINGIDPARVQVPVIGGHAGTTIMPVLSQSIPPVNLCEQSSIENLTKKIQNAGTEVVKAKAGGGSATLSMAFAAARFADSVLRGLRGDPCVIECAYVRSYVTDATYFANPVLLGPYGIKENLGYGMLNAYECNQFRVAVDTLKKNIKKGEDFVKSVSQKNTSPCK